MVGGGEVGEGREASLFESNRKTVKRDEKETVLQWI
jgi:hypothetical protein